MSQTAFSLELKQSEGKLVLYAAGEIDVVTAPVLAGALFDMCREPGDVILDLSGVVFIDSSGLHALVNTARTLAASQNRVIIRRPSLTVIRALEVAGVSGRFTFHN